MRAAARIKERLVNNCIGAAGLAYWAHVLIDAIGAELDGQRPYHTIDDAATAYRARGRGRTARADELATAALGAAARGADELALEAGLDEATKNDLLCRGFVIRTTAGASALYGWAPYKETP